jgi:hypothetical protein
VLYKDASKKYGNPDKDGDGKLDTEWVKENLAVFTSPFPLQISWGDRVYTTRFQAHKLVGDKMVDALTKMLENAAILMLGNEYDNADLERRLVAGKTYIKSHKHDQFDGVFNFRPQRNGRAMSLHALGIAIDLNAHIGAYGSAAGALSYPRYIVDAFEAAGFEWGGDWAFPDAMHFQVIE